MKKLARKDEFGNTQELKVHLWNVFKLCEEFGKAIGISKIAGLTGLLHDYGKYNPLWQAYLWNTTIQEKMDHATWGAKFLCDRYYFTNHPDKEYRVCRRFIVETIANVICGHHGQLSDVVNLNGESPFIKRLLKEEVQFPNQLVSSFESEVMSLTELDEYVHQATLEYKELYQRVSKKANKKNACFSPLFAHHLYSILVDADRTDAREWQQGKSKRFPTLAKKDFLKEVETNLNDYVGTLKAQPPTKINQLRQSISDECWESGRLEPGVYRLATPVGAGKTISSLRFAVEHAKTFRKERIIYVLPFTAIIEQNAEETRRILHGDEWLLEHHGQVLFEKGNSHSPFSLSIAKDNWDAPVIYTTMYQYLMAFYGGHGRNLRRLHHLTNSIVIFDEVQSVPPESISLFNESINYLNEVGNTTVLLCTATQPTLNQVTHNIRAEIKPIVQQESMLAKAFKRVDIHYVPAPMNTTKLTRMVKEKSKELDSILIILNTKSVVKRLYQSLQKEKLNIPLYHLSTDMCPSHRTKILNQVKEHLKNGEKVICVSTPLIEAGVNISFSAIIRSLSGLDSIAQASGRCNRHGELTTGLMYLIDHIEEKLEMLPTVLLGKAVTKDMLMQLQVGKANWTGDIISPEAMTCYYQRYFALTDQKMNYLIDTEYGTTDLYSLLFANMKNKGNYCPPRPEGVTPNLEPFTQHLYHSKFPLVIDSAFRTVFDHYQVYGGEQISVVVPYESGKEWIQKIKTNQLPHSWQREIQPCTINMFEEKVEKLFSKNIINRIEVQKEQYVYILNESFYDEEVGFLEQERM